MPIFPKLKGTCNLCTVEGYDDSCVGDPCVEQYRMAGPCDCTCNTMGFTSCPELVEIENCACSDGSFQPFTVISNVRIGWNDPVEMNYRLSSIAEKTCPSGGPLFYSLYGTGWDFDTHSTPESLLPFLSCPTSVGDPMGPSLFPILLDQEDLVGVGNGSGCTEGVLSFSAAAFGIETLPVEGEGPGATSCNQEGGHVLLIMVVKDSCGNTLILCPFRGVTGQRFDCSIPPFFCCKYDITSTGSLACGEDGGTALIIIEGDRTPDCICPVTETWIIDGTPYVLTEAHERVEHTISPCLVGGSATFVITRTYGSCTPAYNCDLAFGGTFVQSPIPY